MIDRNEILKYATRYWWRPCADGKVWVRYIDIKVPEEAKKAKAAKAKAAKDGKAEDYVGVFLWYPAKSGRVNLEALCLVPKSKAKDIEDASRSYMSHMATARQAQMAHTSEWRMTREEGGRTRGRLPGAGDWMQGCVVELAAPWE